jgi:hypothetical protein
MADAAGSPNWGRIGFPAPSGTDIERAAAGYLKHVQNLSRNGITNFLAAAAFGSWNATLSNLSKTQDEVRALWEGPLSAEYLALNADQRWNTDESVGVLMADGSYKSPWPSAYGPVSNVVSQQYLAGL